MFSKICTYLADMFSEQLVFEKERTIKQAIGFYLSLVTVGSFLMMGVTSLTQAQNFYEGLEIGYRGAQVITVLLTLFIIYKKTIYQEMSAIILGILALIFTEFGLMGSGIFIACLTVMKNKRAKKPLKVEVSRNIYSFDDTKLSLLNIISSGETRNAEFKETFSLETKTKKKEKYLIEGKIKTIAGFLNTDGGTLIIGVDDEGRTIGVNEEIALLHGSDDKYLLHFKDVVMKKIGPKFLTLINYNIRLVGNKKLLVIVCQPSNEPIYVNSEKDFFARTGPATEKLEGPSLVEYVAKHFEDN